MSTIPERGSILLVYFPHSDLKTVKLRPVLAVQANDLDTGLPQVLVAMISSNMRRAQHPARVTIRGGAPGWVESGLRLDSVILADNLATVELPMIARVIGKLVDVAAVDSALRAALAL
jgi:mRNA interferase MazF